MTETPTLYGESKNGRYLLTVRWVAESYVVETGVDRTAVDSITINGEYIGILEEGFEIECADYTIEDRGYPNGVTLNIDVGENDDE